MPTAVKRIDYVFRNAGHFRLVHCKARNNRTQISQQFGLIKFEIVGGQRDIGSVHLQDLEEPMFQLKIAVSGTLGLAQRLHKRIIADLVQLTCNSLEAYIGHDYSLID